MNEQKEQLRTSFYLTRKAEALLGVLRFFTEARSPNHRRLQFLAQSDFWEWEIDNLIYSFMNFQERSRTWQSPEHALKKLGTLGVVVSTKIVRGVRWRGGQWQRRDKTRRVTPVDILREVIDLWNQLVDASEEQFVAPMRDDAEKWNIKTRKDLRHLKKSMPELGPMELEES
jgi:hypothetical protein